MPRYSPRDGARLLIFSSIPHFIFRLAILIYTRALTHARIREYPRTLTTRTRRCINTRGYSVGTRTLTHTHTHAHVHMILSPYACRSSTALDPRSSPARLIVTFVIFVTLVAFTFGLPSLPSPSHHLLQSGSFTLSSTRHFHRQLWSVHMSYSMVTLSLVVFVTFTTFTSVILSHFHRHFIFICIPLLLSPSSPS